VRINNVITMTRIETLTFIDLVHFKLSNESEKAIDSLAMLAESLGMDTIELSK